MIKAHENGVLTEAGYARYMQGREIYLNKHLNLMKNNSMNQCKKCDMRYMVKGNIKGNCSASQPDGIHDPMYDFEKDTTNILNCEI